MKTRDLKRIQQPRNGIQFITNPEVREELKPLVFFDAGKFKREDDGFTIGFHPHSGIGIITYFHGTDLHHRDSGNHDGIIHDGGAQWILAGNGIWHQEGYHRKHNAEATGEWTGSIHQLWVQLSPEIEEQSAVYRNLSKPEIPKVENVKVLVGEYKGVRGRMDIPLNMTYLDVYLEPEERWSFKTPVGQTTGFIFTRDGAVHLGEKLIPNGTMGILEHNDGEITIEAIESTAFIVVLAEPTLFPVIARGGQIHTNVKSLQKSQLIIQEQGKNL